MRVVTEGEAIVCGASFEGLVTQPVAIDFPDKTKLAIPWAHPPIHNALSIGPRKI